MASVFKSKNYDYNYPRLRLKTTALRHSSVQPDAEDTTILFAAFAAPKGPTGKIVKIHTLSEFVLTYGELNEDSYNANRQTIINICNWLNNGGTVYALRLINPFVKATGNFDVNQNYYNKADSFRMAESLTESTYNANLDNLYVKNIQKAFYNPTVNGKQYVKAPIEAKYYGEYYKNIHFRYTRVSALSINATVYYTEGTTEEILEQYYRLTAKNYKSVLSSSEYIGYIDLGVHSETADNASGGFGVFNEEGLAQAASVVLDTNGSPTTDFYLGSAVDDYGDITSYDTFEDIYKYFWSDTGEGSALALLGNSLATPIDVILDAGYSDAIKTILFNKLCAEGDTNIRDDIFLFLDSYNGFDRLNVPTASTYIDEGVGNSERLAVYDQYFTVNDSIFTKQDILVSPTYFISKLLPYIDNNYGVQWTMSGTRRAVLDDVKDINNNPGDAEKESLFTNRINYAEMTARECAFASQRTHDGSTNDNYTALSFINNSRVLEKIKKELTMLGREYLFEFNDSVTLSNMSNVLNKYLNNWISNRTLSYAEAVVAKNPYSDEAVDVTLVVKFTGTIEVISVDITIE